MLKLNIPLKRCTVQVEADTQKELFERWAAAIEVFGESHCGLCQSANIVPKVRTVTHGKKSYDFHELHCTACHARLSYGVHVTGETLFPHRKLDSQGRPDRASGEYGEHCGWTKYRGEPRENGGNGGNGGNGHGHHDVDPNF